MVGTMRRLGSATSSLHRGMKETVDAIGELLVDAFHYLALFAIGATTVWSAAAAFIGMAAQGRASLGDILLLFIYLEIGAMVGIYFKTTRLPVRYLIYVAITALGRTLIEIVGAEHRTGMFDWPVHSQTSPINTFFSSILFSPVTMSFSGGPS